MEYEVRKLLKNKLYSDILSITDGDADFTAFKNKTVVITGAGKPLGYYIACAMLICNDLYSTNISVVAVDADNGLFEQYGKLTYRKDIDFIVSRNYSELIADKADFVIHAESFHDLDRTAVVNLLSFIQKYRATAVISTSQDVYGDVFNGKDRISETDIGYIDFTNPMFNSIQAQRMTESLAIKLANDCALDIKIARTSKIYGAFGTDEIFNENIDNAVNGRNLVVDLKLIKPKSYCYVTDAAEAVLTVLLKGRSAEIYNIASNCVADNLQIASECLKLYPEKELMKLVRKGNAAALSPMASTLPILDIKKLSALGFRPRVKLSEGVKRCVDIHAERSELYADERRT